MRVPTVAQANQRVSRRHFMASKVEHIAARRALGDRLENLAAQKDAEIARLRSQLRLPPSGAMAPKRIVVDDGRPVNSSCRRHALT